MNAEFFEALALLEKEKGISVEYLCEKIENAIAIAIRRDYVGTEDVKVIIDPETRTFDVAIRKLVVEEVEDSANQILLDKAVKYNKKAQLGDVVDIPLETKEFGRIAAQTAKHVIKQGIREAERGQVLKEFQSREHEIITATVISTDAVRGSVTLEIDHNEAFLLKSEQIPGEVFQDGERTKVYVVEVTASERGPKVMISRTHPGLVKRLFEIEVPEIYEGTVEIKAVSREAGSRTKLAVWSKDPDVDAVGACIGTRGARVAKIVDELGGEKIDVVQYSEDPAEFIAAALSPAKVVSVEVDPEGNKACKVKVPDEQLSLAIGNKGQNARLAARLTGWKIDIKPESGFWGEEE
ncbi:MAG: transcription termination/antitermination protein NusA [Oscillospiraceae bacterium]|nr:transcription termination/antitermination protein NusA [Oscillospiraceae bacterium]MBP1569412.1 transcription termination/antitermination protein NusA [Oscillospiraceae bacterium]MBP1574762.1 transcription termination/antitermination protein NusA [Oscillospiraceae bacterium]MBQ5328968.1 transcription termination/antitermination protein NusA [Oscillospiraceae bacterium]MBQ8595914.1 transcription termination/antitermination protein NusA [Oscillospiraceae bacterium]